MNIKNKVYWRVYRQIENKIYTCCRTHIGCQIYGYFEDKMFNSIMNQIMDQVDDQTKDQIREELKLKEKERMK